MIGVPSILTGTSQRLSNEKILITLSYGEGCVRAEEFMAEDLGEEDIVGLVFGFELVATDGAVGASEVALVSREGPREPKAADTYFGSWGPVVVLTAAGEGKLLRSRRVSRAWTIFLGWARTGMM